MLTLAPEAMSWIEMESNKNSKSKALFERILNRLNDPDRDEAREIAERRRQEEQHKKDTELAIQQLIEDNARKRMAQVKVERTTPNGLAEAGIPKLYQDITFSTVAKRGIPEGIKENYEKVRTYVRLQEENIKQGTGLFMTGCCGTMKTTLAVCIMRACFAKGIDAEMICMDTFFSDLLHHKEHYRDEIGKTIAHIERVPMLVLDDLGSEPYSSKYVLGIIERVLSKRFVEKLPTIITSNKSVLDMLENYPERIIDRIKGSMDVMLFQCDSLRPERQICQG